ncbi:MAG: hypothetical protein O3C67_06730 [Cyanobacteria bacterium]|nr:hypothetical protein [Cyanobacteriota bacterium]
MQDQQKATKVTFYLPPALHRQLKIRAAVDGEPMSTIAERAIEFYMSHADVVNEISEGYSNTHRAYGCPACAESLVIREGDLVSIKDAIAPSDHGELAVDMQGMVPGNQQPDEGELVVC